MHRITAIATLAALSAWAGPALAAEQAKDIAAARGHRIAQRACAACHAVEKDGVSRMAKAPAFASLEMRHTASLSGRVEELTRLGHYEMPPIKLRPKEVADLVRYIASLDPR
jgi:mono/diheme cytochrome c family protein